uniref:Putative single-stranded DNA binding protein n=1 Tax=Asparagopsis taxiformis TaxID=260499 RepID=A0A1C9CC10_9FLOR|nr:putative single-stranded DNA binding protein [Asparagopsis taxiformis]AOM65930.1 putative single-stranded DNA binding protein [Asparagopsis taxiformis]
MNICILTARILNRPKLLFRHNSFVISLIICIPNNKPHLVWSHIQCKARGKIAKNIFDLYRQGDYIIVEGYLKIDQKKVYKNEKKLFVNKVISIQVQKVHPTSLTFV